MSYENVKINHWKNDMQMKTLIFTGITILFVITGCGDNSSANGFITADVTKIYSPQKELVLQDFMDVEYIPLETNDEFVNQGHVNAVGEKFIVISNFINDGNIYIYDRTGKAIRKINRKGQGGEEYTYITNITLDEENNEIFVNDHFVKKIYVYDLEGNFKRSFKQKSEGDSRFYEQMFNYDKENLICYDEVNKKIPFLFVSKKDGSITKEIIPPFKEKKYFFQVLRMENSSRGAFPEPYSRIIPFNGNWILFEPSCDTVYTLMPDYSLRPFIARTPSIQTMNPGIFLVLRLVSDRYYFMEGITNIFDFEKNKGFPKTYFVYDTQEKDFFSYIIYNGNYTYKKEFYMVMLAPANSKGEYWTILNTFDLCKNYKEGKLKGKLKEVAAKLGEDDNPVIMLVKPKK